MTFDPVASVHRGERMSDGSGWLLSGDGEGCGRSGDLAVGEPVAAIGNSEGFLDNTVTSGVVSMRTIRATVCPRVGRRKPVGAAPWAPWSHFTRCDHPRMAA